MKSAPHRTEPLRIAAAIQRLSGLALAVFLPVHFLVLGLAIESPRALDEFLALTEEPLVKAAEVGLVLLLGLHFFGGLRLLAVEFLPWSPRQKTYAAGAGAAAIAVSCCFLLSVTG